MVGVGVGGLGGGGIGQPNPFFLYIIRRAFRAHFTVVIQKEGRIDIVVLTQ